MRFYGLMVRLWNFTRDYAVLLVLLGIFVATVIEVYGIGSGPTPQLPPEGYLIENLEARLQWHNGNRPTGYTLQVSQDDPSFTEKLFLEREVTGTTFTLNEITPGHIYFWRLKKDNFLSKTASFKTAPYAITF